MGEGKREKESEIERDRVREREREREREKRPYHELGQRSKIGNRNSARGFPDK